VSWLLLTALLANVLLALAGPRLARALPPATAVPLVTVAMLVAATAAGFALTVLGFLALAEVPLVAVAGRWSAAVVRLEQPVPRGTGAVAGVVGVVLFAAVRRAVRGGRELIRAALLGRALGPHADGLVVLDDDEPDAYALPGISGRIVVSTAMLRVLSPQERRALLAHEGAHLARRHHVSLELAELAAAADPLLRATARAVRLAVEREADEVAAAEVGDRRLVARALARAGLARASAHRRRRTPGASLAGAHDDVGERARALLAPPPRPRSALAAALAILTLALSVVTGATAQQADDRLDRAQSAFPASAVER
jgi:Zn-dependent protease with chaperone function